MTNIFKHIAIIMDGNGRWAQKRGLPRLQGHRQGVETLRNILEESGDLGIEFLTVYAFSTENWNRPSLEVQGLMSLLKIYLKNELKTLHKKGVCVRFIGERDKLAPDVMKLITQAEELTKDNKVLTFIVACSYGARQEIVQAVKEIAQEVLADKLNVDQITPETISSHLYTKDFPDPDLLIRTSGEQRTSNFLLWQSSYSELYFTPTLWPDFSREEFRNIVQEVQGRERRHGLISEQVKGL
ncbi:MAG: isoprenyl transferase [Alphaproteobacteria bacterium]